VECIFIVFICLDIKFKIKKRSDFLFILSELKNISVIYFESLLRIKILVTTQLRMNRVIKIINYSCIFVSILF
jgi:hypothetical protein